MNLDNKSIDELKSMMDDLDDQLADGSLERAQHKTQKAAINEALIARSTQEKSKEMERDFEFTKKVDAGARKILAHVDDLVKKAYKAEGDEAKRYVPVMQQALTSQTNNLAKAAYPSMNVGQAQANFLANINDAQVKQIVEATAKEMNFSLDENSEGDDKKAKEKEAEMKEKQEKQEKVQADHKGDAEEAKKAAMEDGEGTQTETPQDGNGKDIDNLMSFVDDPNPDKYTPSNLLNVLNTAGKVGKDLPGATDERGLYQRGGDPL